MLCSPFESPVPYRANVRPGPIVPSIVSVRPASMRMGSPLCSRSTVVGPSSGRPTAPTGRPNATGSGSIPTGSDRRAGSDNGEPVTPCPGSRSWPSGRVKRCSRRPRGSGAADEVDGPAPGHPWPLVRSKIPRAFIIPDPTGRRSGICTTTTTRAVARSTSPLSKPSRRTASDLVSRRLVQRRARREVVELFR